MKRETKIGIGLVVFVLLGVAWSPVSRYLRLSSQCSDEPRKTFVNRMESITSGVSRAELIRIAGAPDEIRKTQNGDQLVYRWQGLSGFSFDASQMELYECQFGFNIQNEVVGSYGRSPAEGMPNK